MQRTSRLEGEEEGKREVVMMMMMKRMMAQRQESQQSRCKGKRPHNRAGTSPHTIVATRTTPPWTVNSEPSGGTRRSARIRERGLVRCHYYESYDGIELESSVLLPVEGFSYSKTHIGVKENESKNSSGSNRSLKTSGHGCKISLLNWGQGRKRRSCRRKKGKAKSSVVSSAHLSDCSSSNNVQQVQELKVPLRAKPGQPNIRGMTIPKTTDKELRSDMFQTAGVTSRKPTQWQNQGLHSIGNLARLIAQPDPSQEMDIVDQDLCLSNPTSDGYNSRTPFPGNISSTYREERDQGPMTSLCSQTKAALPYPSNTMNAEKVPPNLATYRKDMDHESLPPTCTQANTNITYHSSTKNTDSHGAGATNGANLPVYRDNRYQVAAQNGSTVHADIVGEPNPDTSHASRSHVSTREVEQRMLHPQATLFWNSPQLNGQHVQYTSPILHQYDQEQTNTENRTCSNFPMDRSKDALKTAVQQDVHEQRPVLPFMHNLNQSQETHSVLNSQFPGSPFMPMWKNQSNHHDSNFETYRLIRPSPDMVQADLVQKLSLATKSNPFITPTSIMSNTSMVQEANIPSKMNWLNSGIDHGKSSWFHSEYNINGAFAKFQPGINFTQYKDHTGGATQSHNIGDNLLTIDVNTLPDRSFSDPENSVRQTSLVPDKQTASEQSKVTWTSTDLENAHTFSYQPTSSLPQYQSFQHVTEHRALSHETQVLGGNLTNVALLHQVAHAANSANADEGTQNNAFPSLTHAALLNHFNTCDASLSVQSSPLGQETNGKNALATGHSASTENLQDLESQSNNIIENHQPYNLPAIGELNGSPSAWSNAEAKTGEMNMVVGKSRRLSALRTEMRKGNADDATGSKGTKPKRKKVRCKVLRDKTKSKGRRGPKPKGMGNPTGVGIPGNDGQATHNDKSFETHCSLGEMSNVPQTQLIHEGVTEKTIYHVDGKINSVTLSVHENPRTESNNLATINLEACQLVDFLGLSDEKCRAGNSEMLSGNVQLPANGQQFDTECRDLILYGQSPVVTVAQHAEGSALPLCLFSGTGETSSTGSTELVVAQQNLTLAAKGAPEKNLQLVLYNQNRDIILSKSTRTYKKIRAKVQLDPESQRVWLQLENGGSLETDDDPNRVKYWQKEREDMRKKVESFIQKMHFVQGDRRFSPWKGSIVDSVVGAFLTQNVSDHLSSSAFMSVAARFPAVQKKDSLIPCNDETITSPCETQSHNEAPPLILDKGFFSTPEVQMIGKQKVINSSSCPELDESSEITGCCKAVEHDQRRFESPCSEYGGYYDSFRTPNCHTPEKVLKDQNTQLASDDERNSSCAVDIDMGDGSTLEEVSGAFRQSFTMRNSKARRMLNFGGETGKQDLLTSKQVSFALNPDTEMASDNISDQQSESESVVGSASSVQSIQDSNSNFQLATIQDNCQELNFQTEIVQANKTDVAVVAQKTKNSKKRPFSVSSMSGMERAQLEVNQKGRKKSHHKDWESVRREVLGIPPDVPKEQATPKPRSPDHEDSVNWDAVRLAELSELAETIKERGMHHVLSGRIKAFLTSLYEEHGTIDLEWLRNLSTETGREYLMSIHGLGVKSVECIRLLTLHHLAFPVDTNVGRICVRLGWVPIEPLPEEVQLHLVELYPIQETIQKYLWPRLCTLDQRTLYELHYQLITFGKVFCTKSKPNCNACPLRTECKHFASAYASAKPLLTGPKEEDRSNRICAGGAASKEIPALGMDTFETPLIDYPQGNSVQPPLSQEAPLVSEVDNNSESYFPYNHSFARAYGARFYVEEPASPEQTYEEDLIDIEEMGSNMYIYNNYNDYSLDLLGDNLSLVELDHSTATAGDTFPSQSSKGSNTESSPSSNNTNTDVSPPLNSKGHCSPDQCTVKQPMSTPIPIPSCVSESTAKEHVPTPIPIPFASQSTAKEPVTTPTLIPSCVSQSIASCDTPERSPYLTDIIVEASQSAIVAVPEAAQIPAPKLKNIGRLRTIHYVYELPDDHCLLKSLDAREKDDPCCYLLAIWSPGETPESQQEIDELCKEGTANDATAKPSGFDETVSGTLLIPCRTAMRGSFPLNGTYFQVNEVFADHESSLQPLQVPRSLLWNCPRRFVYFGTSVPNIFKGLSREEVKDCFWRGFVCVRGFDRHTRAPKPLVCRLHFPISKQPQKTTKQPRKKNNNKVGMPSDLET